MTVPSTPADWFNDAPLLPADRARDLGPTLVVAAHPDDEVLGCGGMIALLRYAEIPVRVIIASDGAASHPGSKVYPPAALGALRRAESEAGLQILGVSPEDITFLGLPDGAVPRPDDPHGDAAASLVRAALLSWPWFETVLLPWRRDPHGDHQATWALFVAVLEQVHSLARRLEYPIWSRVSPALDDLPRSGESVLRRYDIGAAREQKRAAVLAHRSQTTAMIDDATFSECLTAEVLARFFAPWEPFIAVGESTEMRP